MSIVKTLREIILEHHARTGEQLKSLTLPPSTFERFEQELEPQLRYTNLHEPDIHFNFMGTTIYRGERK